MNSHCVQIHGVDSWVLLRGFFDLLAFLLVALGVLALPRLAHRNPKFFLVVVGILPAATVYIQP